MGKINHHSTSIYPFNRYQVQDIFRAFILGIGCNLYLSITSPHHWNDAKMPTYTGSIHLPWR